MKFGSLETILIIVVVAALGWLGLGVISGRNQQNQCTPVPLSQEVKAYIDSKIAALGTSQCGEIPKLMSKVSDLQVKLGGIEVYRVNKMLKDSKLNQFVDSSSAVRAKTLEALATARTSELTRIKGDLTNICAGPANGVRPRPGLGGARGAAPGGAANGGDEQKASPSGDSQ